MKLILFFAALLCSLQLYAQPAEETDSLTRLLQQSLSSFIQKNNIQGVAVELYVNGKLYEQYHGYADDAKNNPVIRKTIFEIGSLSKIMTSLLFAQEYDWAKMGLNDPVTKYVKDLPSAYDKITLQDLAMHTAGLPLDVPNKEDLNRINPRSKKEWRYSNVGMSLLGEALATSTESTYGDLYRRHILNPLQMVNGVTVPPSFLKYYAQGHNRTGNPAARIGEGSFSPAYGIKASALDMQRFLSAAIGLPGTPPRVLYPMRFTQSMFVRKNDEFQGLAWEIHPIRNSADITRLVTVADQPNLSPVAIQEIYQRPVYSDNVMMDKTGMTEGFSSYIAVIPGKKSGIVILVNKNVRERDVVKFAREILLKVTNLV